MNIFQVKKKGWKFWASFWLLAGLFLSGWYLFWQVKNRNWIALVNLFQPVVNSLPITEKDKKEILTVFDLTAEIFSVPKEQTFLLLFQNNLEIRPGGGFLGSFGILKIKEGKITSVEVHDTNVFDSRINSGIKPPYPLEKMLNISDWELRDSNWSPDFPTNAEKAEYFYHLEGGTENFDGAVAISTEILTTFLRVLGPVTLPNYPGEYNSDNAVVKLEYQVEKGYKDQEIEKGKRKYVMKDLAVELVRRAEQASWEKKHLLLKELEKHLNQKDIMIYFKNPAWQKQISSLGWDGQVNKTFSRDYLLMVDANLGALKSDAHIRRSFEYIVDFSSGQPLATLKIKYEHTARSRDWMTTHYNNYLRVYTPAGTWLEKAENVGEKDFSEEFGKKILGFLVYVRIGETNEVRLQYRLPKKITEANYELLIQKQSGVGSIPGRVIFINSAGQSQEKELELKSDQLIKF